tara:strand:- start:1265 stop:1576 length:312 start_codon:yes stop_codon:yes gene_type:complete
MAQRPNCTTVLVKGGSMWPTIVDGQVVICDHEYYSNNIPVVGDIIMCQHPLKPKVKLIKRISAINSDNTVFITGDNPDPIASTDSHAFGHLAISQIIGRIDIS